MKHARPKKFDKYASHQTLDLAKNVDMNISSQYRWRWWQFIQIQSTLLESLLGSMMYLESESFE